MAITKEEVKHVAHLARLEFSEEELETFSEQLADILNYVAKLNELDTKDVEPTYHALKLTNVFREDEVKESFPTDEILKNAPERENGFFVVPKVIK
ncbi:glutamyl-tRNA(Gln) amidotransferase, C subunit [Thermodesulfatator indicus DSM 15286]|uniref:Aspartyl/glutamyl-tRNA(Asn/Gln) amidotransferase subunit C n=1 Tax=Thermodesulfatator indicus (strain DSM 15286 / JCM 11887 / CIR29812) TaxID=667014 RepID=F8AB36_THEID|nr:Asp-tRNA(Asn)/Glu-tRNA(Gln) amidotransferase subunit GatC [Thermodesulfatator indicus]AEH44405.1 glutamyl-tRNA(Gln) amidotransferase, C subunit [Thermodesulfatator indicus DSM 15286]